MRYQVVVPAAILLGVAVTGGCRRADETKSYSATTVTPQAVAAAPAESTILSAGAIGTRSEAQDHFDRSRQAFMNKDMKTAAAELHDASVFMRTREDSATGYAKALVTISAAELDTLSRNVAANAVTSAARLDHAFAHANRAEAERHFALATRAWSQKQAVRAGEELTMALDHFERAIRDAAFSSDSGATGGIARGHVVANELLTGATPAGVDAELKDIELQLRRFGAKLENQRM